MLPFTRFLGLETLLVEADREEAQEKFTLAAFIGWQMGSSLRGPDEQGEPSSARPYTFLEHLKKLGLAGSSEPEPGPGPGSPDPELDIPVLESQRTKGEAVKVEHPQGADYDMLRALGGKRIH